MSTSFKVLLFPLRCNQNLATKIGHEQDNMKQTYRMLNSKLNCVFKLNKIKWITKCYYTVKCARCLCTYYYNKKKDECSLDKQHPIQTHSFTGSKWYMSWHFLYTYWTLHFICVLHGCTASPYDNLYIPQRGRTF